MTTDLHVDGNALGGLFMEAFGREMTDARGCCASCSKRWVFGALVVYPAGPGDVVRCPHCENVVMVVAALADGPRLYLAGLRWIESAQA